MLIYSITFILLSNAASVRRDKSILFNRLSITALLYSAYLSIASLSLSLDAGIGLFGGLLHITSHSQIFHLFSFLISALILQLTAFYPRRVWSKNYSIIKKLSFYNSLIPQNTQTIITNKNAAQYKILEYPLILLFIITGAALFVSSSDLVSIFLSIELLIYGLYLVSTIYRNSELATSGGLSYFLLGGLSSGFILLGTSLLYANSGTTDLDVLYVLNSLSEMQSTTIAPQIPPSNILYWYKPHYINMSLLILSVGFLFKLGVAFLHLWSLQLFRKLNKPIYLMVFSVGYLLIVQLVPLGPSELYFMFIPLVVGYAIALASIYFSDRRESAKENLKRRIKNFYKLVIKWGWFILLIFIVLSFLAVIFYALYPEGFSICVGKCLGVYEYVKHVSKHIYPLTMYYNIYKIYGIIWKFHRGPFNPEDLIEYVDVLIKTTLISIGSLRLISPYIMSNELNFYRYTNWIFGNLSILLSWIFGNLSILLSWIFGNLSILLSWIFGNLSILLSWIKGNLSSLWDGGFYNAWSSLNRIMNTGVPISNRIMNTGVSILNRIMNTGVSWTGLLYDRLLNIWCNYILCNFILVSTRLYHLRYGLSFHKPNLSLAQLSPKPSFSLAQLSPRFNTIFSFAQFLHSLDPSFRIDYPRDPSAGELLLATGRRNLIHFSRPRAQTKPSQLIDLVICINTITITGEGYRVVRGSRCITISENYGVPVKPCNKTNFPPRSPGTIKPRLNPIFSLAQLRHSLNPSFSIDSPRDPSAGELLLATGRRNLIHFSRPRAQTKPSQLIYLVICINTITITGEGYKVVRGSRCITISENYGVPVKPCNKINFPPLSPGIIKPRFDLGCAYETLQTTYLSQVTENPETSMVVFANTYNHPVITTTPTTTTPTLTLTTTTPTLTLTPTTPTLTLTPTTPTLTLTTTPTLTLTTTTTPTLTLTTTTTTPTLTTTTPTLTLTTTTTTPTTPTLTLTTTPTLTLTPTTTTPTLTTTTPTLTLTTTPNHPVIRNNFNPQDTPSQLILRDTNSDSSTRFQVLGLGFFSTIYLSSGTVLEYRNARVRRGATRGFIEIILVSILFTVSINSGIVSTNTAYFFSIPEITGSMNAILGGAMSIGSSWFWFYIVQPVPETLASILGADATTLANRAASSEGIPALILASVPASIMESFSFYGIVASTYANWDFYTEHYTGPDANLLAVTWGGLIYIGGLISMEPFHRSLRVVIPDLPVQTDGQLQARSGFSELTRQTRRFWLHYMHNGCVYGSLNLLTWTSGVFFTNGITNIFYEAHPGPDGMVLAVAAGSASTTVLFVLVTTLFDSGRSHNLPVLVSTAIHVILTAGVFISYVLCSSGLWKYLELLSNTL